jgi:excinuclease UvrABC ATPase subunit
MEMFQKNSPKGMCVRCLGTGHIYSLDESELFRDKTRTLINLFGTEKSEGKVRHYGRRIEEYCHVAGLSPYQTIDSLTEDEFIKFKYGGNGTKHFNGVIPWTIQFYKWCIGKNNWGSKLTCVHKVPCPKCNGSGLSEQAAHTTINGKNITQIENMYISDLYEFLKGDKFFKPRKRAGRQFVLPDPPAPKTKLLEEILIKLECMIDVGLHHLALSRPVPTLSGGEIQRLFLASYIIAEMDSIIFIFDEPTIGLHEVEKQKLIDIIKNLIGRGNTVVAVEHDTNFMQAADYIIDLGPGAGEFGGERIFQGSYADFMKCENSLTSPYLSGRLSMPVKSTYKPFNPSKTLKLENCAIHNLQNISVNIPLGLLVGVSGVSGSGKSSIITDTLVPKLKEVLKNKFVEYSETYEAEEVPEVSPRETGADAPSLFGEFINERIDARLIETESPIETRISGFENIKKCVIIDQKPIGRSRTSCPATYTGIFDRVRRMFAEAPEAVAQGFKPGMFSVNAEGKCRTCNGDGVIRYYVGLGNFIDVDCEACGTTGFTPESMTVTVDGKNIRNILEMDITNAIEYFKDKDKTSYRMLKTLDRVGLGYMSLGQKTPTISGGEAQRIKLAKELGKSGSGRDNVYILDEPTTGLSFSDSEKLTQLMQELVDNGNTVIVTEHDPVVLSNCDYIIEMGPGGGSDGGFVIATGTPAELKNNAESIIGRYLK